MAQVFKWIVVFAVMTACVDPITFDALPPLQLLVVDGSITDEPGPYRVKISNGIELTADSSTHAPVSNVKITLHDDEGSTEALTEREPGDYWTAGVIRGKLGHSYYITIEMPDGKKFESEPEKIMPAGEVKDIHYQFEARTTTEKFGVLAADVFNIFVDGDAPASSNGTVNIRWRFTGTYKVLTFPQFHRTYLQGEFYYATPYECSGFRVAPALGGGTLEQIDPCTCCTCWVNQFDTSPQLSDAELVSDGQFRNVKVGEVPISTATFYEKYRVDIEQMTLSNSAFEFFKLVKTQKEGTSNLFQPPSGRIVGNIRSSGAESPVVGLFWAAAISRKSIFIQRSDVPYVLTPPETITEPCTKAYANSNTTKPANWDE